MRAPARALLGGLAAWTAQHLLASRSPGGRERWRRTNYRGAEVSLSSGPALAVAAGVAASGQPAALLAGLGAGSVGWYDDAVGSTHAKGLSGHLRELRRGRVTTGSVKVAALAATGLATAGSGRDRLVRGAVIAGAANLLNLLDLRPGRALKAGLVGGLLVGDAGVLGACAALLPGDLGERTMLGDTGANSLGAVLGAAFVRRHPSRAATRSALVGLVALTALSEVVSFSALIEGTGPLRWIDELGRAR